MKKIHFIMYPLTVLVAMGIAGSVVNGSIAQSQTKTVTALAECDSALDLAGQYADAVAGEHVAIGGAFEQAAADGDIEAMANGIYEATEALKATTVRLTPKIAVASEVCRAALATVTGGAL